MLELPQRLAEYAAATNQRLDRLETLVGDFVESTNRRFESLETSQAELAARQTNLEERQTALEERMVRLEERQTALQESMVRLEERQTELATNQQAMQISLETMCRDIAAIKADLRPIKGAHARNGAEWETRRIARTLNCFQVGLLNSDDLYRMLSRLNADDISPGDRESFEDADLVIEAEHRDTGETHYIAIEASCTAHADDTRRAIRNAGYLTRATGQPAHAVVASWYVAPDLEPFIAESDQVRWHAIARRHIEPD